MSVKKDEGLEGPALATPAPKPPSRSKNSDGDEVGRVLRSAYEETLREDVPDDFMDLLGKLN